MDIKPDKSTNAKEYHHNYYLKNYEKMRQYRLGRAEKTKEYNMKYRAAKKEELQAARMAKVYCIFCDRFYSHSGLLSHSRSDVHKNNVKSYTLNNENKNI